VTVLSGRYEVDAYLVEGNKVPVPKYIWKFVRDGSAGIVFIIRNDPTDSSGINLCSDIFSDYGWDAALADRNEALKGKTICCSISDLKAKKPDFPIPNIESQNIISVLQYQ
jgi:hypothetical protein